MRAILLVGGLGTRLRPLTENRPKALIPVLNRPFISYLLDHLKEAGVTDVVFAAGHLAEPIKRIFPTYSTKNFRLHFAEELRPLGTGGAIRFAFERFKHKNDPRPVLVFNGDVLFDLSLKRFNVFHRQKKSSCTIALKKVDNPAAFGVVETTRDGRIRTFVEKPHSYTDPSLINAGVYAIDPHLILAIPMGQPSSVERDVFPRLLSDGVPMYGYVSTGYWNDIGTHKSYMEAHRDLLTLKNSWTEKFIFRKRAHQRGRKSTVFLGEKTQLAKDVILKGMVCCGRGVRIAAGATIEDSILLDNVRIEKNATVTGSILGTGSKVESGVIVPPGSVLGDKTRIKRQTQQ